MNKYNIKYVKDYFISHGCKLLDNEYKNVKQKLNYICKCNNISSIKFEHFFNGHRCQQCRNIKNKQKFAFSFDYVKEYFSKEGCLLLENNYINNRLKLKYKCKCGNEDKINFNNFKNGKRCRKCSGCEPPTTEFISSYFKEKKCKLLDLYQGANYKMKYVCQCGNKSEINWRNFKNGRRCKNCKTIAISGKNNYQWREDRKQVANERLFARKCYSAIKSTRNLFKQIKLNKSKIILGYSPNQLMEHIINHKNWENVKDNKWHLDHIFPIKAFADFKIFNITLANSLDNLQPLSDVDNISKNCKYNKIEFIKWLNLKASKDEILLSFLEKISE